MTEGTYLIVRTSLACGEDSLVDTLFKVLRVLEVFAEEDQTSTGTTKGFMSTNRRVSHE